MTRLNDKFTVEQMKDFEKRLNGIFYQATHGYTRSEATPEEKMLLGVIDHLCRVPNMLCSIIEQELKGEIVTAEPHDYTTSKLGLAEAHMRNYIMEKGLKLSE